jgi:hypothetical protein
VKSIGAGTWLRGGALLALGVLWLQLFEPFAFPNNDYFSFERAAHSFAAGEWPDSFKRGPILPALMALGAPLAGAPHPELRVALACNLLFSLGFVALLFRFGWRTFPAAAPWFALLVLTTPVLHAMALQPLVEPNLAFFVALSFVLLRARSPWQYAAAAAAALSRPEAAALAVILAACNVAADRRWLHHAVLAAAALVPFAAWNALGAAQGSGAAAYGDLMQTASARGLALVGVHYLREGLGGWTAAPGAIGLVVAAGVGLAVGGIGVRRAVRDHPREAWAALAWLAVSALAVAVFGISKSRYVLPTVWVLLAFVSVGAVELARPTGSGPARLGRLVPAFLLVPLAVGGVLRGHTLYTQVRDFDRGVLAPAAWLGSHLATHERVAILHTSQVLWATDLRADQVVAYGEFAADDAAGLPDEMRARGVTHAAWTWRRPAQNTGQAFYDDRKKVSLAETFRDGEPVDEFDLVATLPAPERLGQPPARIYRLAPP